MKKIHWFTYLFTILTVVCFYFKIIVWNVQWFGSDTAIKYHWVVTSPIDNESARNANKAEIEPSDSVKYKYVEALFHNGHDYYLNSEDNQFEKHKKYLIDVILKSFTYNQLIIVDEIDLIGCTALSDDNEVGLTHIAGTNVRIVVAAYSDALDYTITHEFMHALYFNHYPYFEQDLKTTWLTSDQYVSSYAKTDLTEDFAETGSFYLVGDTLTKNPKFKLIKLFLDYTK